MLKSLLLVVIYIIMHVMFYFQVFRMFHWPDQKKKPSPLQHILKWLLVLLGGLYPVSGFLQFMFSIPVSFPKYIGFIWLMSLPSLTALALLCTGFTMAYPTRKAWWRNITLLLLAISLAHIVLIFPFKNTIPVYILRDEFVIIIGILIAINLFNYQVITSSLDWEQKKRAWLIIAFSSGGYLAIVMSGLEFLSIVVGFYGIIYARIVNGLKLPPRHRRVLLMIMITGFIISIPQMSFWGNVLGITPLYFVGGVWYGVIAIAFILFLFESLLFLINRSFIRIRVVVSLLILAVISGYALYNGQQVPRVKRVTIPIKNLPDHLVGFTIVQWSDLHLGDLVTPAWLEKTVETTNQLHPDLLVITGDLIDKGYDDGHRYLNSLKKLKARFGVLAVTGNHEYYNHRLPLFLDTAKKTGIRVLRNEWVLIANDLQVAGVNDPTAIDFNDAFPDIYRALKGIDKKKPVILLCHQPGLFNIYRHRGVSLQLSGHTHAGQIPPMNLINHLFYSYNYGLYHKGNAYIYTSSGTGLWGIPMRLFSSNEITLITLIKQEKHK